MKNPSARLSDQTVDRILDIVRNSTDFKPQSTLIYYVDVVKADKHPKDRDDVQVLFGGNHEFTGHWITTYYNSTASTVTVFDSLGVKGLDDNQIEVLHYLYPFIDNIQDEIIHWTPKYRQKDCHSCGVFALSYMLSLVQHEQPEFILDSIRFGARLKYEKVLLVLRRYLMRIVRANKVIPFDLAKYVKM